MTMDVSRISPYDVVTRNDPRFDGQFYSAVMTTGIFCRPGCPARPRAENVRFFATAAAAAESGFRPCLRCHPELAPDPPEWQHASPIVSRALRLIGEGILDESDMDELARRLNISCRQLQRLFVEELGAPPVAVAQTRRLLFAKKLIDETNLSMAEIAFSAGYASVRRFNEAIRQTYARTPTDLRQRRRRSIVDPADATIDLKLFYRQPYNWPAMFAFLAEHATPQVEIVDAQSYRRTIRMDDIAGIIEVRPLTRQPAVLLRVPFNLARHLLPITERVKQIFDLKADPVLIDECLLRDPDLAPIVRSAPGTRLPGSWDGYEIALRALLDASEPERAGSLLRALVTIYGEPLAESNDPSVSHLFPTPERLATAPLAEPGLSASLSQAIARLSQAVVARTVSFDGSASLAALRDELGQMPLLNVAAIDRIALRVLGDPDIDLDEPGNGNLGRSWRSYAAMYRQTY
jgi:AraC family transcriptional regulator of adaptative response / DNA-3-methyladenine glycosylase II